MNTTILATLLVSLGGLGSGEVRETTIADLIQPAIDEGKAKSVLVAYRVGDEFGFVGLGAKSDEDPTKPDADTVYEIGSITKVFTGNLLADMVRRGEVKLDTPVQELLPEGVLVPKRGDGEITLLDLTTHTSGLPRLPTNFSPKDWKNPYADYSVEQLESFLTARSKLPTVAGLASVVGQKVPEPGYAYSNLGAGLLGHVLSRKAGTSYEDLVVDRLCEPLGLDSTRVTLDADLKERLAPPYGKRGERAENWDLPTLAGAGALRSSGRDMLAFLDAVMGERATDLRPVLVDATKPRREIKKDRAEVGLGWHLDKRRGLVWHNGGTGGYRTYAGFIPEKRIAVVVLGNQSSFNATGTGVKLIDKLRSSSSQ
ncbi:D-alanyl-D-alanine-carboxypeptidase/endopeptidase AmpH precursor [Planctomycetes bacterium Pan216]|uniref:D-alanyl-D-alanine-carboxypeptidase/endopeptidase AmpH n=1 Tax=Kolteria novifilia TaxID=2527975 RepID=A0A518B074_9BACT|nr:D-alanyl-D-alanine-carboxypeptidase/endopeptidase AmpH precursor [Planctomycetes bacterium Pan216]